MREIIYRLDRGPFSGVVTRHNDGPWAGWFSYHWSAAGEDGGTKVIGKQGAISGLQTAYCFYLLRQAQGKPRLDQNQNGG